MISAKFLWGNALLGGKLQIGAKNSNFEIFESALYMKSVSIPLRCSLINLYRPYKLFLERGVFKMNYTESFIYLYLLNL